MKVLLINAVYGRGSTGTIVRDIEQLCEQNGIDCYVASPDPKVREAKRGYIIGNIFDHKVHAVLSRINGRQAYFSHIPTWKLCHYIDRIKPDIVHLHNLHSNYIHLNILLKYIARKDIKTIITLHDCWFFTGGCFHYTSVGCNKWKKECGQCPKKKQDTPSFLFDYSSAILSDRKKYLLSIPQLYVTGVSEWISREASNSFLRNIPNYVIHNGIDLNVFKPTPSELRKTLGLEGRFVILGPASKWLLKINRDVLYRFSKFLKPDEVLLLFGNRDNDIELPANVMSYGYTNNKTELAQLYTMADIFANVTREDSLSLINLEAQACGTPVVTFDQTGPKETVDDVCSRSIPVGNAELMYETIESLKQKKNAHSNETLLRFIKERFNIVNSYMKYIDLYKSF